MTGVPGQRPVVRVIVYLAVIVLVAAGWLAFRGATGLTVRNAIAAVPIAILCAVAVWLRWDVAPRRARERRARAADRLSADAAPVPSEKP